MKESIPTLEVTLFTFGEENGYPLNDFTENFIHQYLDGESHFIQLVRPVSPRPVISNSDYVRKFNEIKDSEICGYITNIRKIVNDGIVTVVGTVCSMGNKGFWLNRVIEIEDKIRLLPRLKFTNDIPEILIGFDLFPDEAAVMHFNRRWVKTA